MVDEHAKSNLSENRKRTEADKRLRASGEVIISTAVRRISVPRIGAYMDGYSVAETGSTLSATKIIVDGSKNSTKKIQSGIRVTLLRSARRMRRVLN